MKTRVSLKYFVSYCKFNGVYSRDNLPKTIKDKNLDKYADVDTHCIAFYVRNIGTIYFVSIGVDHVPKEIEKFIGHKNNSITCGYFCIGFIYFMLPVKIDSTSFVFNLWFWSKRWYNLKLF